MTRASDTAKLLGAGATILDGTTISTADNTAQLTLTSTDADSNFGPLLTMYRNSSSPADADFLGDIEFQGENSAGETITYAQVFGRTVDVTDGTEDGRIAIKTMRAGASRSALDISATEIIFNDDSEDVDFRVESNGNANMLFVDGGNDRVGIGTNSVSEPLRVQADSDTDFDASGAEFNRAIMLKNSTAGANNCVTLAMATESNGEVFLSTVQNSSNNAADFVISTRDSGARAERMRISSAGYVTQSKLPMFNISGGGFTINAVDQQTITSSNGFTSSTEYDPDGLFNHSNGRFTAPVAGRYFFIFSIGVTFNSGYHYSYLFKNGANVVNRNAPQSSFIQTVSIQQVINLAAGDYVTAERNNNNVNGVVNDAMFCGFLLG